MTGLSPLWKLRLVIGAVALAVLGFKFYLADTTYGTNDVSHWVDFSQAIQRVGPVHIYSYTHFTLKSSFFNHPPLIGYYLDLANHLTQWLGWPVKFTIRAGSSIADFVTCFLLFEMVRLRRTLGLATLAALAFALSPIMILISGFHGNTDPLFTMFTLLSAYLLVDRRWPIAAGAAIALALGVKIVPIVAVPALLVCAWQLGRMAAARFAASAVLVSLVYWGPALLHEYANVKHKVIGYAGVNLYSHYWGLDGFGGRAGTSAWTHAIEGSGRTVIVALCALLPAVLVVRRRDLGVEAVALSLCAFLVLSPTFGTQYLVWAAGASLLVSVRGGVAYNLLGGALLTKVYARWNGDHWPWRAVTHSSPFTHHEELYGYVVWGVLLATIVAGVWRMMTSDGSKTAARPDPANRQLIPRRRPVVPATQEGHVH